MAREIARGHFFAFYWGQSYGGVEPYVLALSFIVAGQSPLTLDGTPVVLALIGSLVVWRIGLHLFRSPAALVAAVLSWIWSESTLWNSTKEYGFHEACAVLGLVVLLQAVRIVGGSRAARRRPALRLVRPRGRSASGSGRLPRSSTSRCRRPWWC